MTIVRLLSIAALSALLSACAGSVSAPTAIAPLSPDQKANLHVSDISADAESGVAMSDGDFGIICQKVRSYITIQSPSVLVESTAAPLKMKILFTRFDRGMDDLHGLADRRCQAEMVAADPERRDGDVGVPPERAIGNGHGAE